MSDRCHLDTLTQNDFSLLVELFTSPAGRQFLGGPVSAQLAAQRSIDWITRSPTESIWAIRDSVNLSFLGYILLDDHHDGIDLEISYALLPSFWGQGLATEALTQALKKAFSEVGVTRIIAETQARNLKSIALLKRVGMTEKRRLVRFEEEQIIFASDNPLSPSPRGQLTSGDPRAT